VRRGWRLRGLRARLILGFVSVALIGGLAMLIVVYVGLIFLSSRGDIPGIRQTAAVLSGFVPSQPSSGQTLLVVSLILLSLLGFIVALALLAARRVLRPVRRLAGAASRLADGDLRVRLTASGADEMTDLVHTFNEMATSLQTNVEELHRLNAQSQRFAGDVSHELRTPLAAMMAVTDLLDEQADCFVGDAGAAARLVSRETRNLNRLVADLIEISRFDAGAVALQLDDVNLPEAVHECLRVRGWTDQVAVDLQPDLVVRLDPRRLDVIIANLVGNALRHGAPPVTAQLWMERLAGTDWVWMRVSDCGTGLPPSVLPHVFERFYKADTARTRSEGSGLGLAIAWENARLHGGRIEATNRPHGGAAFTVRLPA
jgi:two-component system sensor histidine kinase MtrB